MNDQPSEIQPAFIDTSQGPRLPRIALMGEFSAGKSTLANLMIGSDPLPVQVIATRLPPVWVSYGNQPAVIVDLDGNETLCDLNELQDIDPEITAYIRIYAEEDLLKICDIIDMPGISDPNMSSYVWERMMPMADGVVWCSPATQAWRQSEAAVWDGIAEEVRENSILLLTRADMLVNPKDREKVSRRVASEAGSLFAECMMISLLQAKESGDDTDLWVRSGAEPFVNAFLEVIANLSRKVGDGEPLLLGSVESLIHDADAIAHDVDINRVVPRRPVSNKRRSEKTPRPFDDGPESFSPKFS